MTMGNGIFAAIVGFFGVIIGTLISKNEERRKSLIEVKQKNYSDWWELFHQTQKEVIDVFYSKDQKRLTLEDDIKIGELFRALSPKENIISMYLSKSDGDRFFKLVATIKNCYSINCDITFRLNNIGPSLDEIREIFRDSLRENIYRNIWKKIKLDGKRFSK